MHDYITLSDTSQRTPKMVGKKSKCDHLANVYDLIGWRDWARKVRYCADWIQTACCESGERYIVGANYCGNRLCPLCAWRRTIKIGKHVSWVLDGMDQQLPGCKYLFLTLTVPNPDAGALDAILDKMMDGYQRLCRFTRFRRAIKGWFRALEITYNADKRTYHPHFHCILAVNPSYFKSRDYITQKDWVTMWRRALQVTWPDLIVDIRMIRPDADGGIQGAVVEVSKYTVKPVDYCHGDYQAAMPVVQALANAIHKRRLVAFGGLMRDIHRGLDVSCPIDGDLTDRDDLAGEIKLRREVVVAIEKWHWTLGAHGWDWVRTEYDAATAADRDRLSKTTGGRAARIAADERSAVDRELDRQAVPDDIDPDDMYVADGRAIFV